MPSLDLTPRQIRLALDVLTALVIISVAFALAGLTWRLAGHAGSGAVTVPSGAAASAVAPDMAPAIALAPFGKAATGDGAQPTALPLELKGVFAASPAELSTAFIAVSGAEATPFRVGEAVAGGTIQAILRDRVVIANAGRSEYLAFPDPAAPPVDPNAPAPPVAKAAPVGPPPPPATNAAALIARLGATPSGNGYRIGEGAPPGLQPGDVVQSVNGAPLADAQSAQAAFAAAAQAGTAQITIVRDGRPITLTVPTR